MGAPWASATGRRRIKADYARAFTFLPLLQSETAPIGALAAKIKARRVASPGLDGDRNRFDQNL
jgi:hypothetical protein